MLLFQICPQEVAIWDLIDKKLRLKLDETNTAVGKNFKPLCGDYIMDGVHVAIGDTNGRVSLFNLATLELAVSTIGHEGAVDALTISRGTPKPA